ncbi:hypothetical protein SAMN05444920_101936 [Nonomuraea solani]|uniref:Uncharacterized protein n=1 Tax=Nonomuraea solani TaxID=1144553 RepID=A0A1H5VNE6_9ACTN|nr:hypothetical protein [Nonomuraea solani]SEF88842.1 hypothetical protein SAMN05444920_101936 [Nonomuraea solani]
MTIDERRIADELRRMAAEATPIDAAAYARRASTRSRRRSWPIAGLAAAALAAVVIVVPAQNQGPDTAVKVGLLPDNDAAQRRLVSECMPKGGPVHNMDGNRRIPEHGSAEDFRVLVEARDEGGSTALVGSTAGFVLCTPTTQRDFAERAVFTYWGNEAPGDMRGFSGDLRVDGYTSHTHSYAVGERRIQRDDVYRVVVGRVTESVRRVGIDWADGRRTEARMAGGFFIARVLGKVRPDSVLESPDVTVTAYGAEGQVLGQEKTALGPLGSE